jgi:hypothetical protein
MKYISKAEEPESFRAWKKLRRMRASAIRQLNVSTLTPEQKQMLIEYYNAFDEFGCYSEFCTTIAHVLMR